jgi:isopenicillin-N N-acyltransferase like protein
MRARGSNHTFGDRTGRIWDVETSAYGAALIEAEGCYAHTNHYAAPAMAIYEGYHKEESRRRLQWAQDELAAGLARGDEPEGLVARVLRSHEYAPESICGHPDPADDPADQIMTVASLICDLDAMELKACAGPPCENPYRTFAAGLD